MHFYIKVFMINNLLHTYLNYESVTIFTLITKEML